ncbi:MAG: TrkH family potassium uptake protein [Clostridia bacterium]|nr:TrkH family potassium uptake protein [Clostridia bacterium]
MNRRMVFYTIGQILLAEAAMLIIPALSALYFGESGWREFFITAAVAAGIGFVLTFTKPENRVIYAREGFAIVALAWVVLSVIGCLPFYISGEIPRFENALFETVSGFTTTGASILENIEGLSRCMLLWRSFTHWIGGIGVLFFVMAVIPLAGNRSIYLMRAELTGPVVDKIVPKMRDAAKIIYAIYIALTVIEIVLLLIGGMPLFDSVTHAFSTAGTGGFSVKNASIAAYGNPYFETVITVFMILFGINLNLFYFLLIGNVRSVFKNEELRAYVGIIIAAIAVVAINLMSVYESAGEALRYASFQVAAILTTTGFATADYTTWPEFSKVILLILMFCGACAGSTTCSFKIARVILLFRILKREIRRLVHPRAVSTVKLGGKVIEDNVIIGTCAFLAVYIVIALASLLLLSVESFDFETRMTAVVACLNNIGPGFGKVGPSGNYALLSGFSKAVLMIDMLFGRLEIFPVLLTLAPATWRKRA